VPELLDLTIVYAKVIDALRLMLSPEPPPEGDERTP